MPRISLNSPMPTLPLRDRIMKNCLGMFLMMLGSKRTKFCCVAARELEEILLHSFCCNMSCKETQYFRHRCTEEDIELD